LAIDKKPGLRKSLSAAALNNTYGNRSADADRKIVSIIYSTLYGIPQGGPNAGIELANTYLQPRFLSRMFLAAQS
jgi:hypothetical protein